MKSAVSELFAEPFAALSDDLRAAFRPQREWAQGQGLWLILAFFCSGVGAGTWIFASPFFFDVPAGLVLGFLLMVAGSGGAHLIFLGHPTRAWRMLARVGSSWVSRGMAGIALFSAAAIVYLLPALSPSHLWAQDGAFGSAMMALSIFAALWVATYKGFVFAAARGIPFWNSPLMPPLFIAYALRGGLAVLLLVAAAGGRFPALHSVEIVKLWTVVSSAALVLFYIWGMSDAGVTAHQSVMEIVKGRAAGVFYLGVLAGGIAIPVLGGALGFVVELPLWAVALIGLCSLLGDLSMTWVIAKAGIYRPAAYGAFSAAR